MNTHTKRSSNRFEGQCVFDYSQGGNGAKGHDGDGRDEDGRWAAEEQTWQQPRRRLPVQRRPQNPAAQGDSGAAQQPRAAFVPAYNDRGLCHLPATTTVFLLVVLHLQLLRRSLLYTDITYWHESCLDVQRQSSKSPPLTVTTLQDFSYIYSLTAQIYIILLPRPLLFPTNQAITLHWQLPSARALWTLLSGSALAFHCFPSSSKLEKIIKEPYWIS